MWMFRIASVADPWHFGVDPDPDPRILAFGWWIQIPDPAIFAIDIEDAKKKQFFIIFFLLITFWMYIYIIFQR